MGFFSKLFNRNEDATIHRTVRQTQPDVIGPMEYRAFNYVDTVVADVPRDVIFTARIIRNQVEMPYGNDVSVIVGGGGLDGYVLAYQGKPFGLIGDTDLCEYLDDVKARSIACVWHDWYEPTIRQVKAMAPSVKRSAEENKVAAILGKGRWVDVSNTDHRTVSTSKAMTKVEALLSEDGTSAVTVSLSMVPTPKGSTAKPHVVLNDADDTLFEFSARSQSYGYLAGHVGMKAKALIEKRTSDFNDGFYYSVTLVF